MSDMGRRWPGESTRAIDARTGAVVWQITQHPSINHNLYFLTSSFVPHERALIFASFRNGNVNFFQAEFPEGDILQLTDSADINGYSAVIGAGGSRLFFTRGSAIVALDLAELSERVLADFPGGKLGEVDLSADGSWIVSAIRIDNQSGIVVAAADGSGGEIIHRQSRTIIHPQFNPIDSNMIEYAADPAPRMFLIGRDGTNNRCLYENKHDEFVVHETWLGETGDLVFTVWPHSLKRFAVASGNISTIADFNAWHICPSRDGRFILCDTNHPDAGIQCVEVATGRRRTLCYPASSNRGSQWARSCYALKEDFEAAARAGASRHDENLSWMEMKVDTVYGPQWTHPHPSFSDSGRYVTFTSDRSGHPQVYVMEMTA